MANDKGGILFHVGEFVKSDDLSQLISQSDHQLYDQVIPHGTVYDAVVALKALPKEKLQSIKTFLLDDDLKLIDSRPKMLALQEELLGGQVMPEHEMCAVFLAGKIKAVYAQQALEPPAIIMGADYDRNVKKTFPNIDKVMDDWDDHEDRLSRISELSIAALAERQKGKQ